MRLKVNAGKLAKQLARVGTTVHSEFNKRYLPTASALIGREQNRHFMAQQAPNGSPWKPLSDLTKALSKGSAKQKVKSGGQKTAVTRRTDTSKALMDTGLLRASVTVNNATGAIREITPNLLTFGTNLKYGPTHQFGAVIKVTKAMRGAIYGKTGIWIVAQELHIPARPFLGTGDTCRQELGKAAGIVLQKVIKSSL
jgi:phage gpG-like protein